MRLECYKPTRSTYLDDLKAPDVEGEQHDADKHARRQHVDVRQHQNGHVEHVGHKLLDRRVADPLAYADLCEP